jgi:predicted transcriptional regulator
VDKRKNYGNVGGRRKGYGRGHLRWSRRLSLEGRVRYEKGHLFEVVVAKFFEYKGYEVKKNERFRGASGAVHEIDIALYKMGKLVGVVEAKNYDKPVPKEWVMKIHNVGVDVGASEYYVVSATGFTEDAIKVARVMGVQLLSLDDLAREVERFEGLSKLPLYHLKPLFKPSTAVEYASRHARKKLFKTMEEPGDVDLFYAPFYLLEAEYAYVEKHGILFTREYEVRKRVKLLASAVSQSLLVCYEDMCELVELPNLTEEEAELLKIMMGIGDEITYSDLEEETGWNRSKLYRLVNSLVDKGLVETGDDEGRKVFTPIFPLLDDFADTVSELVEENDLEEGSPAEAKVLEAKYPVSNIKALVKRIFDVDVKDVKLVYLPIYRVKMESTEDETYRYLCLLAIVEDTPIEPCME